MMKGNETDGTNGAGNMFLDMSQLLLNPVNSKRVGNLHPDPFFKFCCGGAWQYIQFCCCMSCGFVAGRVAILPILLGF
jgi:hypothetical protein